MTITDWLRRIFGDGRQEQEYDEEKKAEIKLEQTEAEDAIHESENKLQDAKQARNDSESISNKLRLLGHPNHFAERIRQAYLEGR